MLLIALFKSYIERDLVTEEEYLSNSYAGDEKGWRQKGTKVIDGIIYIKIEKRIKGL